MYVKYLLTILVLFLAVNIGIIYYFIFLSEFPAFSNRLDLVEKRVDAFLGDTNVDPALAATASATTTVTTTSELSEETLSSIVSQVSKDVQKQIALDSLKESGSGGSQFGEINHDIYSTIGAKVTYIPLGQATAKSAQNEWKDTPVEIDFNKDDYGEIESIRFEATVKIPTNNGQAKVRLYDTVSGYASGSEILGEGTDGVYVKSGNVLIADGDRTLRMQILTTLDYEAIVENARIRVERK